MLFDIDMKKKIPIREGEDFNLQACLSVDREEKKGYPASVFDTMSILPESSMSSDEKVTAAF